MSLCNLLVRGVNLVSRWPVHHKYGLHLLAPRVIQAKSAYKKKKLRGNKFEVGFEPNAAHPGFELLSKIITILKYAICLLIPLMLLLAC
jgi:hypothetical protein